jgi:UDP:flavonoid glycosyltransferase YjiC (YdhE family)
MISNYVVAILLMTFISQSFCLNALFISDGAAGHVTPVFEFAKAMKNHNVTFLTSQAAQVYIKLNSYSSPSFRIIYANDSPNAFFEEKNREQQLISTLANRSLIDSFSNIVPLLGEMIIPLLKKTIDILTYERFDVIVAGEIVFGIPLLCEKIQTPCVIQSSVALPNILDFNLPNTFSLLTSKELTQLTYRIYNTAFTMRVIMKLVPKLIPAFYTLFHSLPRIPGPFYDSFALTNLLVSQSKCLNLISMPPSFVTPSYSHHYKKYLGAFIDKTSVDEVNNVLNRWIKSKARGSIVYGAFGSSSIVSYDRMYNLINGLAMFLLQADSSCLLLAFRETNYDTYQAVLKNLENDKFREVLKNKKRVRIENGFVQQKWILQQNSVKLFLSHCGMGSCLEALYFSKPVLCMPFNMDQFSNANTIDNLGVGQSLFVPPSWFRSLMNPYDFAKYTFTARSVTRKILALWMNVSYEKEARLMSLEMKHAGGLKRAVEEIEFFVNFGGDLDRFAPFQSTLSFYQRYMLDLLLIFVILPATIIIYIILKCYKRQRKMKTD